MLIDLIVIILACLCLPGVAVCGGIIILMFPAYLRQLESPISSRSISPQMGCLYLLAGPFRILGLYAWRFVLQPGIHILLLLAGGMIALVMRFGILIRFLESTADSWASIADRLWQDNLNAETLFRTANRQNTQRTRSLLEQLLMRFAPVKLLNRSLLYSTYDILGVSPAIPTVLAAIARDDSRPLSVRLGAIDALRQHGFRSVLLNIALDRRRDGLVVCHAAEALEIRLDWRAAEQAWDFLLEHLDPGVRLRAANYLKLDPAQRGKASACLRLMFNDERLPLKMRIEAIAASGRVNQLSETDLETLQDWMSSAQEQEARLIAAYTLACLRGLPAAFGKLRRYCYEYQHADHLRSLAIEYLGRLDRLNDLRPLGRMDWIEPSIRMRVAEILVENGHTVDAVHGWLALAQDAQVPLKTRLDALKKGRQVYKQEMGAFSLRDLLVDALSNLGSDGEPAPWMRLEAARTLVEIGQVDPARHILLILSQAKSSEPALRRQAVNELRRLSTLSISS